MSGGHGFPSPARSSLAGLVLLLLGAAVSGSPAEAREWRDWCGAAQPQSAAEPALGWHFYCDPEPPDVTETPETPAPVAAPAPPTATERIEELRRQLAEARARAILDPVPDKVAAYLELQRQVLARAAAFSDAFRRTVWASPDLDYTLTRPVGALARQVWTEDRRTERDAALSRLSERWGLIYLGHPDCGGCRVFGPLLRAFALRYRLPVLAVSMTGGALEGWPEAVPDQGRAARLGLAGGPFPALVLFDSGTGAVTPVGFGVLAEDQMAERIFLLTQRESGHDY